MTRRTYRRRHPVVTAVAVLVLMVFVVLPLAAHLAGILVLVAVTGFGCYRLGLFRRVVAKASITAADPQAGMLLQETVRLRRDLDEATARAEQYAVELQRVRAQVDDLEDAAARPIEAIAATYRKIQKRMYQPAGR